MKRLFKTLLLAVALPAALVACQHIDPIEKPIEPGVNGHSVTISAGLPEGTRISHVYEESQIKPYWEEGDQVKVSFTKNAATVVETFTLLTGAGTQSATFHNNNSQLDDQTAFTVDYVDKNHLEGWAVQDGTLAHLPECLSADVANITESATLVPSLTYFHVVFENFNGGPYTSAYLSKLEGNFTMYTAPGVKGAVTVTPASNFSSGEVDFYIAVKLDGRTSQTSNNIFNESVPPEFQVCFGNSVQGISADGQAFDVPQGYKYNWRPSSDYVAGRVYKMANKIFRATTAAESLPR